MTLKIVATIEESRAAKNAPAQRLKIREEESTAVSVSLLCIYHKVNKGREICPRFSLLAS